MIGQVVWEVGGRVRGWKSDRAGGVGDGAPCLMGRCAMISGRTSVATHHLPPFPVVKMLRLVRLAKVFRLLRVGKVFTLVRLFMMHLEDKAGIRVSDNTVKLLRLLFMLLVAAHWIACLSYTIVRIAEYVGGGGEAWVGGGGGA